MDAVTPPPDFAELRRQIEEAGQDAMNPDAENRQVLFEQAIRSVLDFRAHAIEIRFRQVRNPEVRRKAHQTSQRAERKVAQLLIAAERAGLRYMGRPEKGAKVGTPTSLITLEKLGISRKQSQAWQRLARMSDAEFEVWLEAQLAKKSERRSRRRNAHAQPGGAGALVPIRPGIQLPGKVTRTGWRLPKDMSFVDWLACGQLLDRVEGSVQWWRGDWWAFSAGRQWGEGEALAEKAGVNYGTARTYGSVARAYELSMRIDNLTFDHHRVAMAAETTDERQAWLRRAEAEGWSVAELRAALAQGKRMKVARQAELDGEKDGQQSEPTPSDQGSSPSPSPQTAPELESAPEPVKEPAPADDDALAQELAPPAHPPVPSPQTEDLPNSLMKGAIDAQATPGQEQRIVGGRPIIEQYVIRFRSLVSDAMDELQGDEVDCLFAALGDALTSMRRASNGSDAIDVAIESATPIQEDMPPSPGATAGSVDHSIEGSAP